MLKRLHLFNFRSYDQLQLQFGPGIHLFYGENGAGKTNILEAICFLSLLRSFRTSNLEELCSFSEKRFTVYGEVVDNDGDISRLGIEWSRNKVRYHCNGTVIQRASDMMGRLITIPMVPQDIMIVKGSPALRRKFFDLFIALSDPSYLKTCREYRRCLMHRNRLLKGGNSGGAQLKAFDQLFAGYAAKIVCRRFNFLKEWGPFYQQRAEKILPEGTVFSIHYRCSLLKQEPVELELLKEAFCNLLEQRRESDLRRGVTSCGPHHDDFDFLWNQRLLSSFGSEGQCRIISLLLKLAQTDYFLAKLPAASIVLLIDDVMGELDTSRTLALFEDLPPVVQVFVTDTSPREFAGYNPTIWHVCDGRVNRV